MKLTLYQVDAFTSRVFGGNPAGVVPLDAWLPDAVMQSIAIENNLSETAFFIPSDPGYDLRWFTPATEVDLCGHATLGSAYVLFNELGFAGGQICFHTRNEGDLFVSRDHSGQLALDFPSKPPRACTAPPLLAEALGVEVPELFSNEDYLVVLPSERDVAAVKPDFKIMQDIDTRGIIVTAPGDEVDFVSRFFAPRYGIDEDPVTGSAHCVLTPFWSARLGKEVMTARQVSRRTGELVCSMRGERVSIAGHAVLYMKGEINLDLDR